jgi:hypothetical protein
MTDGGNDQFLITQSQALVSCDSKSSTMINDQREKGVENSPLNLAAFCASVKNKEMGRKEGGISNERNDNNSVSMTEMEGGQVGAVM